MTIGKWNIKLLPPGFSPWAPRKVLSKQIAVLMSGGVDSSVAAHILKEDGWDVLGITMKVPVSCTTDREQKTENRRQRTEDREQKTENRRQRTESTNSRGCCGVDAAFVCNELNIPHHFVDVAEAFQRLIVVPFRESYAKGQTPNPCVDCNTLLKFSLVWDFLKKTFGISYLATGHYARVIKTNNDVRLGRAKDKAKDQSYFIYGIAREKLRRLVLPLGGLTKNQVRTIAAQINLSVADKPESMELCFAGQGDYRAALTPDGPGHQGDITDMQGNKIAKHEGIANYTLGQRRGVGFAGGKPLYVGRIDTETNTIALGTRDEVSSRIIVANQINTLIPEELFTDKQVYGKIRSYGTPEPCKVIERGEADLTVEFDGPQFAPCPGQKLVLYNGEDNVIAGGTIMADFRHNRFN